MKRRRRRILSGRVFRQSEQSEEDRVLLSDDTQATLAEAIASMIRNGQMTPGVSFIPAERDGMRAVLWAIDSVPGHSGPYCIVAEMFVSHFTMAKYKSFADDIDQSHTTCGCMNLAPDRPLTQHELDRCADILRLLVIDFAHFHSAQESSGLLSIARDKRDGDDAEVVIAALPEQRVPLVEVLPTEAARGRYREIGPRTYVTLIGEAGAQVVRQAPIVVLN